LNEESLENFSALKKKTMTKGSGYFKTVLPNTANRLVFYSNKNLIIEI